MQNSLWRAKQSESYSGDELRNRLAISLGYEWRHVQLTVNGDVQTVNVLMHPSNGLASEATAKGFVDGARTSLYPRPPIFVDSLDSMALVELEMARRELADDYLEALRCLLNFDNPASVTMWQIATAPAVKRAQAALAVLGGF